MSHLMVGLISVGLGIWGMASWWSVFGLVMRGIIPFFLLVFGLIAILAACRRIGLAAAEDPMSERSEHEEHEEREENEDYEEYEEDILAA